MFFKKEKKKQIEEHSSKNKMAINTNLSIIILNVNGLNTPIKRHRIAEWIRKQYAVYKRSTSEQKIHTD